MTYDAFTFFDKIGIIIFAILILDGLYIILHKIKGIDRAALLRLLAALSGFVIDFYFVFISKKSALSYPFVDKLGLALWLYLIFESYITSQKEIKQLGKYQRMTIARLAIGILGLAVDGYLVYLGAR